MCLCYVDTREGTPLPDYTEQIDQAISDPSSVTVDGTSVSARPIPELIEAAKFADEQALAQQTNRRGGRRSGWAGLAPAQVIPPGGV